MTKLFNWLSYSLWLIIAILISALCVANRDLVIISFDPVSIPPLFALEAPLYLILIGVFVLGLCVGSTVTWLRQARHRASARQANRKVKRLEQDVARLEAEMREKVAKAAEEARHSGMREQAQAEQVISAPAEVLLPR